MKRWHGSWTNLLLAASCVLLVGACAAQSRYRVLSFFFDGVPDPNAPPEPVIGPTEQVDFSKMTGAERAAYLAKKIEAPEVYYHPPVRDRQCESCHAFTTQQSSTPSWLMGSPELLAPIEELCARCHEPPSAPFVHGPVSAVRCDICHAAHQSPFPHLLKTEKISATCLSCHEGELFVTRELHEEFVELDCDACHDPHKSDFAGLLRPDWEQTFKASREHDED